MSSFWQHVIVAVAVILLAFGVAKLVDMYMSRRKLAPQLATRYGVLRRTVMAAIVFVGVMSALLVIPQVRAVAGAILASSAVLGIIFGLAAQQTLGNFIAGISLAFTQPVRLGDSIEVDATTGVVEEIGLTYTWVRTKDGDVVVIPNQRLASETIRNKTIRRPR
jgi:small-conductance mechanosensitive channel